MNFLKTSPALKFSIFFITGILAGSEFYIRAEILFPAMIFILLVQIYFLIKFPDCFFSRNTVFVIIFLFGIIKSCIDFYTVPHNSVKFLKDTPVKSYDYLSGVVMELPDYDSNKVRLILSSEILKRRNDTIRISGDVIVTIRQNRYSSGDSIRPDIKAGDRIIIKGRLSETDGKRNPGEFDYGKYLSLHNVHKTFSSNGYSNIKNISGNNLGYLYQKIVYPSKIFALNSIDENSNGDNAAYLKGLVTGERSDISNEMKESFIDAGVMHLIAVSGLNVAYIILSVTLVLSVMRIPALPRIVMTIIILILYCIFTGSPASIVRATVMGIIVLISFILERKVNFYNSIGVSALIILFYDSKQIYDSGFILSFSAVISMVVIYGIFEKSFINKITDLNIRGKKFTLWILALFFTSFAAQIGTLPLTAAYFGKISIVSLIANIVVVPAANLSLAIGFFQITAALFSSYISSVISETNNLILSMQLLFIQWCSSFNFAFINIPSFSSLYIIVYYLLMLVIITVKSKCDLMKRGMYCILIVIYIKLFNLNFTKDLRVTFLDIGQGDCSLIQTPDDKVILVDCGMINGNFNSGERTIFPYMQREGIKKIDLLIITHLHSDHTGGMNYLLNKIEIGKIIESGKSVNSAFNKTTDSLILQKNIPRIIVRSGDFIEDIKDLRIYFLFPDSNFVDEKGITSESNLNNGSVAFKLKYIETEMLFTGDIEKEAELKICSRYGKFLKTDILKTAHHGSITSSTIPFVINARPYVAVISCGKFNKFNHPSDIVLNRFRISGAEIFRTDKDGAVLLKSNGYKTEVIRWK